MDQNTSEEERMLQERYSIALEDIRKTSELITKRLQVVEAKEANWVKLMCKIQEDAEQAAKKVKLDVGGKVFCISKAHLLSVEASYFHAMLASGQWKPDSDDAYFIDRNPKHFDRVLDYMRTGKISFTGLRPDQIDSLRETLDYLQLGNVYPPVVWDPQMCGSRLRLSEKNRTILSCDSGYSVRSLYPCVRYSVRLDSIGYSSSVFVGFAPEAGFKCNDTNKTRCGWYLYAGDGCLYSQDGDFEKRYKRGKCFAQGSVITCIFDQASNSICFEVDGQSLGVAYTNLSQAEVYAAMSFCEGNISISLVDNA